MDNVPFLEGSSGILIYDRLYVFGGKIQHAYSSAVYEFNLDNSTWRKLQCDGKPPWPRVYHSAVLHRFHMIIFGGLLDTVVEAKIRGRAVDPPEEEALCILDLFGGSARWTHPRTTGHQPPFLSNHAAVSVGNYMYVVGGYQSSKAALTPKTQPPTSIISPDSCEIYQLNMESYVWSLILPTGGSIPPSIWGHSTILHNKMLISYGGIAALHSTDNSTLNIFHLDKKEWRSMSVRDPPGGHSCHSAVVSTTSPQQRMLVFGGFSYNTGMKFESFHALNLDTGQWETMQTSGTSAGPIYGHVAVLFDNKMVVYGGNETKGCVHFLDLGTKKWTAVDFKQENFSFYDLSSLKQQGDKLYNSHHKVLEKQRQNEIEKRAKLRQQRADIALAQTPQRVPMMTRGQSPLMPTGDYEEEIYHYRRSSSTSPKRFITPHTPRTPCTPRTPSPPSSYYDTSPSIRTSSASPLLRKSPTKRIVPSVDAQLAAAAVDAAHDRIARYRRGKLHRPPHSPPLHNQFFNNGWSGDGGGSPHSLSPPHRVQISSSPTQVYIDPAPNNTTTPPPETTTSPSARTAIENSPSLSALQQYSSGPGGGIVGPNKAQIPKKDYGNNTTTAPTTNSATVTSPTVVKLDNLLATEMSPEDNLYLVHTTAQQQQHKKSSLVNYDDSGGPGYVFNTLTTADTSPWSPSKLQTTVVPLVPKGRRSPTQAPHTHRHTHSDDDGWGSSYTNSPSGPSPTAAYRSPSPPGNSAYLGQGSPTSSPPKRTTGYQPPKNATTPLKAETRFHLHNSYMAPLSGGGA